MPPCHNANGQNPYQSESRRSEQCGPAETNIATHTDIATLHEDWYLRYCKLKGSFDNERDDSGEPVMAEAEPEGRDRSYQELCETAVAVRAGRLGTLEWGSSAIEGSEDVEAIRRLLDHTRLEMDEDAAASQAERDAFQSLVMPTAQATPVDDDDDVVELDLIDDVVPVDVNLFFEEFPQCIRPGWNVAEADDDDDDDCSNDSDSDNDETVDTSDDESSECESHCAAENSRRKRRPLAVETTLPARLPGPEDFDSNDNVNPITAFYDPPHVAESETQNHSSHQPFQDQKPLSSKSAKFQNNDHKMYKSDADLRRNERKQQQTHQQQLWRRNCPPQQNPQNNNYQQQQQQEQNRLSWEAHHNQQNPFQTAREYAAMSNADDNNMNQRSEANDNYQQGSNLCKNNNGYSESRNQLEESESMQQANGPPIRESLKRKFQPPKRVSGGKGSGEPAKDQLSRKTGGAKLSNRNGQNKNSKSVNNAAAKKSVAAEDEKDDDDDDDLPEELQRFGKELVDKITDEIMDSGEAITFNDIAGLKDAKSYVQESVCWPIKRPDLFTGLRTVPKGLLLYGPPGTGKTLIGKAIAHESGATFFSISSSSLTSKWIGEGEKLVRTLFAVAAYREPSVVFIDEIDSILTARKADENEASRRMKTEFLVQLDGCTGGTDGQARVLMVGATNKPQELDEAVRRRFTIKLYIPLPEEPDRKVLLKVLLKKNEHRLTESDLSKIAKQTAGFSGADLKTLCNDAALGPIRDLGKQALKVDKKNVKPIAFKHFRKSLKGMKPSVAPADLEQYIEWDKAFGSKRSGDDDDDDDSDSDDDDSDEDQ